MSLPIYELVFWVAIAALLCTIALRFLTDKVKSVVISFLQLFSGLLFLVSGWVKLVDPIGTAYKLEQYFGEFETTFEGVGALAWMSGLFPWLSCFSAGFSMLMIVLEMVIGITLVLGLWRKLTAWAFLLLIIFFTALTGFTYLTGYVPTDANFFDFSSWTDYEKTQMRVTDCGCFGDFIKLDPKVSFMKDVFLLGPGILLLLFHKKMHALTKPSLGAAITGLATVGMVYYGLSNYVWNIPDFDFRPFKAGSDIRTQRQAELDAAEQVQITHLIMEEASTGKQVTIPYADYAKEYKKYPKPAWSVVEQIKTTPTVPETKLSHFMVETVDGEDLTATVLENTNYALWVVSHKLSYTTSQEKMMVTDTIVIYDQDTATDGTITVRDSSTRIVRSEMPVTKYVFDPDYMAAFDGSIRPIIEASGLETYAMYGGMDPESLAALKQQVGLPMTMLDTDDILLKTIVRSCPGLLLVKDGTIIDKWHYRDLPDVAYFTGLN